MLSELGHGPDVRFLGARGQVAHAHAVEQAIFKVLAHSDIRTRDIGGRASTRDVGEVIAAEVSALAAVR